MRHLFLARPRAQRILIAAGLVVLGILGLDFASGQLLAAAKDWSAAREERALQQEWTAREAAIEAAAAKARDGLGNGKGYDAARLVAEVAQLATEAGLTANTDPPKTQRSGAFAVHTVQLTVRRTDLPTLVRFYRLTLPRAPYLAIGGLTLQGERSSNGSVGARLQVTAVELVK